VPRGGLPDNCNLTCRLLSVHGLAIGLLEMSDHHPMRLIPRDSAVLGAIDLFDSLARKHELDLTEPKDVARFATVVEAAVAAGRGQAIVLHGRRVQAMFAYVAASLGEIEVIKEEDAGRVISRSKTIQTPDYRVLLENGDEFFVEVKNCHKSNPAARMSIKRSSFDSLAEYARVFGRSASLAVYWSKWNAWTLVPFSAIELDDNRASISFLEASKRNEMVLLGDLAVGTKAPLVLRFVADPDKPRQILEGGREVPFTIGAVEMYCGHVLIEDNTERNIAFYLMRYGRWIEEAVPVIEGNLLKSADFVFRPVEDTNQGFEIVGNVSGMISQRYNELTTTERSIRRLTPGAEPSSLGLLVDDSYKGRFLPLWRIPRKTRHCPAKVYGQSQSHLKEVSTFFGAS
jgi:hypothetical protein